MLFLLSLVSVSLAAWSPVATDQGAYTDAVTHLAGGRLEAAEAGFSTLLSKDPTCGMALHGRAITRLRLGDTQRAKVDLDAAIAAYPDQPAAHVALSVVQFAQQDFGAAEKSARTALQLAPADIDAQAALQNALLRRGDLPAARAALSAVRDAMSPSTHACFQAQIAQEAGDAATVQQLLPQCRNAGEYELARALEARQAGDVAVAALAADASLASVVRTAQAVELFNDADYTGALVLLDALVAERPGDVHIRVLRARTRHALQNNVAAREDLEAAFAGKAWVDVHRSGVMTGILRKSDELAMRQEMALGAALYIEMLLEDAQVSAARRRTEDFRSTFGTKDVFQAAEARLLRAEGKVDEAWALLSQSLSTTPTSPFLLRLASEWSVADPTALPSSIASLLQTTGNWQDGWNLAVSKKKAGDSPGCLTVVQSLLDGPARSAAPDVSRKIADLGIRCAIDAQNLAAANALLGTAGGPTGLGPATAYNLALQRYNAGDARGAAVLVSGVLSTTDAQGEVGTALVGLAVRARLDEGALPEATLLAQDPRCTADDRFVVASHLNQAGNEGAAYSLLTAACPSLTGDRKTRCDELLSVVERRLRE